MIFFVILAHFAPVLVQLAAKLSIYLGFTLNFCLYQLILMVCYYIIMFCHKFMQNVLKLRVIWSFLPIDHINLVFIYPQNEHKFICLL